MKKYILWSIFLLIVGCGKKDGVHTEYFDDEKEYKYRERTYKDGKVDGLTTIWYEKDSAGNRQKHEETTYKDGKKDGLETEWYENGKIKQQGNWNSSGVFIGFKWDKNGNKKNISISPPKELGTGKNECPCCGRRFDHRGYRIAIHQNVVRPGAYDSESCAITCEKVNGLMK